MKNISLLPAELRKYRSISKKVNRYTIAMAFFILAFVLIYAVLSITATLPQQQLNSLRQQRMEMQNKIAEMQQYENLQNTSETARKLVSEAMGTNPQWDSLFVDIFNSIPEGMRLSGFSSTYSNNKGNLSIKGWAKSNTDVADWLTSLKKMEGLSNVQCQFAMKTQTDSGYNVQFEIDADLTQGGAYEIPAEGSVK